MKKVQNIVLSSLKFQIGRTNEESRGYLKEKRDSRMAIHPFLVVESSIIDMIFDISDFESNIMAMNFSIKAERDRELAAYIEESRKKEAEIMKNRPDWKVGESVYSKRWNPPTQFRSQI